MSYKQRLCRVCGVNKTTSNGIRNGRRRWKSRCDPCIRHGFLEKSLKGDSCEFCGFVPVHPSQLDLDHIDGNHKNNSPENLQTLCANCHRLKTILQNDYVGGDRDNAREEEQPLLFAVGGGPSTRKKKKQDDEEE